MTQPAQADVVTAPLPPHTVLTYVLTTADARAWEAQDPARRRSKRAARAGALLAGLMLLSVTASHLPDWLSRLHSNALAFVILCIPLSVLLAVQHLDTGKRAAERIAAPVEARLEVWDRRLAETRADRNEPLILGAQSLRGVIETGTHLFLYTKTDAIILPTAAFPDAKARDAFAGHWEKMVG